METLGRRAANASRMVETLYSKPVTISASLATRPGLSQATTDRPLTDLRHLSVICEMTGKLRGQVFSFREYHTLVLE